MSRGMRWSLLGLVVVLLALGQLQPDPRRELTATTFGTAPIGYQGVFDVLTELGLGVQRSYDAPPALPAGATVWWIEPDDVCRSRAESSEADAGGEDWRGAEWIAAGGRAVIFLPPAGTLPLDEPCAEVAGLALPARQLDAPPSGGRPVAISQTLGGTLTAAPRIVEAPELASFTEAGDFDVVAWLGGRPFALERRLGQGRLVLLADARVVRNQWLDRGDAAPLVLDLVRAYGVPRFDERSHGLHRERAPLRYLVRSPAVPALIGALVLGLLYVWSAHALPPRAGVAAANGTPTLTAFVDSLARLYAGTGDHARVLERYRQLTAARLRRRFGLPPETPLPALLDRLARSTRASTDDLARLAVGGGVTSAAELGAAVRKLDALVEEAVR